MGQKLGVLVVFGQAFHVMLQGVKRSGGDDSGLAHPAAEEFAVPPGFVNQLLGAGQGRAHRSSQPLAEADAHRVEVLRPLPGGNPRGHHGVEKPCSVQVGAQAVLVGPTADRFQRLVRPHPTTAAVVGVFQAHESRPHQVFVLRADHAVELLGLKDAVAARDRPGHHAA